MSRMQFDVPTAHQLLDGFQIVIEEIGNARNIEVIWAAMGVVLMAVMGGRTDTTPEEIGEILHSGLDAYLKDFYASGGLENVKKTKHQ